METIKKKLNLKDFNELTVGDTKDPKNVQIVIENNIPSKNNFENPDFKKVIAGCLTFFVIGFCFSAGGILAYSILL